MAFFHNNSSLQVFILLPLLFLSTYSSLALASATHEETPFNYREGTGKGPKDWGRINPKCGNGKLQSPIDLTDNKVQISPLLGQLKTNHKPAPAVLKDTGHDIQLKWAGDAGSLIINGTDYKLLSLHWHTPYEHTINGQRFDLDLHAVHKNSKGETAVIGTLYKDGQQDPLLSKFLPKVKSFGKDVDLGIINAVDFWFDSTEYYRYIGSLTTPPCTEGVIWTVVKKVKTVSTEQVATLKGAIHDEFKENARPTQAGQFGFTMQKVMKVLLKLGERDVNLLYEHFGLCFIR